MIVRRCVCCLGFSRFFFSRISLLLLTRTLLHQSEKHFDKKEKILVIWGGAFNKRRDFETRRDFLFLFFFEGRGKKRYFLETKESFHLLQKSARALKEHRHTRAHTKPEREREKKTTTLFSSSSLIELFVYFVFVFFARTTEREKERRHFII